MIGPDRAAPNDPLRFVAAFLEQEGAAVESSPHRLEALLPGGIARALGLGEEVALSDDQGEGAEDELITYGSPALERILAVIREGGSVCRLRAQASVPRPRDLESMARGAYRFHTRTRVLFQDPVPSASSYLLVHFSLVARSEDSHEALILAIVNETTGAPVPSLEAVLTGPEALLADDRTQGEDPLPFPETLRTIEKEAVRLAERSLASFRNTMMRRRARDLERLFTYYASLAGEGQGRGSGRPPRGTAAEDRIRAIQEELDRKANGLDVQYGIRARLRPAAVSRVTIPSLRAEYRLQWRREERTIPVVWNPLLSEFEPLACDVCRAGGMEIVVPEDLRMLCKSCAAA